LTENTKLISIEDKKSSKKKTQNVFMSKFVKAHKLLRKQIFLIEWKIKYCIEIKADVNSFFVAQK
jgi:hypothetical protein